MWMYLALYLAAGALFYLRLMASVNGAAVPPLGRRHGWHRVRRFQKSVLRRLRF